MITALPSRSSCCASVCVGGGGGEGGAFSDKVHGSTSNHCHKLSLWSCNGMHIEPPHCPAGPDPAARARPLASLPSSA